MLNENELIDIFLDNYENEFMEKNFDRIFNERKEEIEKNYTFTD